MCWVLPHSYVLPQHMVEMETFQRFHHHETDKTPGTQSLRVRRVIPKPDNPRHAENDVYNNRALSSPSLGGCRPCPVIRLRRRRIFGGRFGNRNRS